MASTFNETRDAFMALVRRLRAPVRLMLLTVALFLAGGLFEGATVGLLVPLLGVVVAPSAGIELPIVGRVLDWVPEDQRALALGVSIVALVLTKNLLVFGGTVCAGALRSTMLVELRRQLLERVMQAPPATLERHTSGEITDVFVAESYRVNRFVDACVVFVQRVVVALSYLVAMLFLSWRLTLVTLALGAVAAIPAQALGRRAMRQGRKLSEASGALGRHVTEVVGGLRVIRTTASQASFSQTFTEESEAHARAESGVSVSLTVQQGVIETLGVACAVGLIALAHATWLGNGELDAPRFLAFGFGLVRLLPSLNFVYATHGLISASVGSIERIVHWLDLPTYPTRPFGSKDMPRMQDGIRLEAVGFSYGGHEVLRGLSFSLPAGETLAVFGPSGAGKSTLASLLLRLREPTHGKIFFDGNDYWEFSAAAYHESVGFVDQEPFLFNLSIAENVAAGRRNVSREAIMKALNLVQLGDLIARLPYGVDTVLAERGATLSGGQRQRLAIARAVVVDPQVLVLDEPTSALDADTEQEVVAAMHAASVGRTTIIITHRPAAAKHATWKLDLSTGKMARVTTTLAEVKEAN
jgi:subfamily B ATP-binding cassette protein MsbA